MYMQTSFDVIHCYDTPPEDLHGDDLVKDEEKCFKLAVVNVRIKMR